MALPFPSIRKIMRETFSAPALELTEEQREPWFQTARAQLARMDRVECEFAMHFQPATQAREIKPTELEVSIRSPNGGQPASYRRSWDSDRFTLKLDQRNQLSLHPWSWSHSRLESSPVASLDEVMNYVEAVKARQERRISQEKKRDRVQTMQRLGWIAKLKRHAQDHGFQFATHARGHNFHVLIRIDAIRSLVFVIPRKEMEQRIDSLAAAIPALLEAARNGLEFEISRHWANTEVDWQNHQV